MIFKIMQLRPCYKVLLLYNRKINYVSEIVDINSGTGEKFQKVNTQEQSLVPWSLKLQARLALYTTAIHSKTESEKNNTRTSDQYYLSYLILS